MILMVKLEKYTTKELINLTNYSYGFFLFYVNFCLTRYILYAVLQNRIKNSDTN